MMFVVQRMILGYDVGLGKSAITICAYAALKTSKNPPKQMIVAAPRSAVYQWQGEINKFTDFTSHVIDTQFMPPDARIEFYQNDWEKYDVLITTYSILYKDYLHFYKHFPSAMVVLDEILVFKNRMSKMYQSIGLELSEKAQRLYGLSATILKNNLDEPYNIFRLVVPGVFPSVEDFEKDFCRKEMVKRRGQGSAKGVPLVVGYKNIPQFFSLIDPYFIGCKKIEVDTANLPPVTVKPIFLKMLPHQRQLYTMALEECLPGIENENIQMSVVKMLRCQQISNAPRILDYDYNSSKEDWLSDMIKEELEQEDKMIIFSRSSKVVNYLVKKFHIYKPLYITGEISSAKKREDIKIIFSTSDEHRLIFINTAAREAINLQAANYLTFYDLDWSYGDTAQIIGRMNRLGSTRDLNTVYVPVNKGTIDEYVYQTVLKKENYFTQLLGGIGYEMDKDNLIKFVSGFKSFCYQAVY